MSILSKLTSAPTRRSPDHPETPAEIEAEIGKREAARAEAKRALAIIAASRAELLATENHAELDTADRAETLHFRAIEAADLVLPELRRQLAELKAAAGARRRAELGERYVAALTKHLKNFRATLATADELMEIRKLAQAEGFDTWSRTAMEAVPNVLTHDAADLIDSNLQRARNFVSNRVTHASPPPASPSPPPAPPRPVHAAFAPSRDPAIAAARDRAARPMFEHIAEPSPEAMVARPKRPLHKVAWPIPAGTVAVKLRKGDIEIADERCWKGDELALPEFQARSLVERQVAELLTPPNIALETPPATGVGSAEPATEIEEARP